MELKPINWNMIKNPLNWLVILIMIFLGVLGAELFLKFFNVNITNSNLNNEVSK